MFIPGFLLLWFHSPQPSKTESDPLYLTSLQTVVVETLIFLLLPQGTLAFYVKLEEDEAAEEEGVEKVVGTVTLTDWPIQEPEHPQERSQDDKRAKYPPPDEPPPGLPRTLTCPLNMTPTVVGILRGTILNVSTHRLLSGGV